MGHHKVLKVFIIAITACLLGAVFSFVPLIINPDHSISRTTFKTVWSFSSPQQILGSPILAGNLLIFATYDGSLQAISTSDGQAQWSIKLSDYIFSLIINEHGIIYAGTGLHASKTGFLFAIEPQHGKILWKHGFDGHLEEPPALDEINHRLWLGTGPGSLWAVDTGNGMPLWHAKIGHLDATPLLHENKLFVPAQKDEVTHETFFYALNPDDGTISWKLEQPGQPWASPIIDQSGTTILTNTAEGQIGVHKETDKGWAQALTTDGKILWHKSLPDMALTPNIYLADQNEIIYVTKNGKVLCVNIHDGSTQWEITAGKGFSSPGTLIKNFQETLIATTSEDGVFTLVNVKNGKVELSRKMGTSSGSASLTDGHTIYITTSTEITALGEM